MFVKCNLTLISKPISKPIHQEAKVTTWLNFSLSYFSPGTDEKEFPEEALSSL